MRSLWEPLALGGLAIESPEGRVGPGADLDLAGRGQKQPRCKRAKPGKGGSSPPIAREHSKEVEW